MKCRKEEAYMLIGRRYWFNWLLIYLLHLLSITYYLTGPIRAGYHRNCC